MEGYAADVAATVGTLDGATAGAAPTWPAGAHRGRISVPPNAVDTIGRRLTDAEIPWLGEAGIGTIHVATDRVDCLAEARELACTVDGWMLREAGAPGLDGFGIDLPNVDVMARVKHAVDPEGKMNPGRLPIARPVRT